MGIRFLFYPSWPVIFLLAVVMCLLILSKYHRILVIGFTVLTKNSFPINTYLACRNDYIPFEILCLIAQTNLLFLKTIITST